MRREACSEPATSVLSMSALSTSALLLGALVVAPSPAAASAGTALVTTGPWFQPGDLLAVDVTTGVTTTLAAGDAFGPCFSPEGDRVAFWRDGQIFSAGLDGGDLTYVCDSFSAALRKQALTWSADGHIYWSESGPHIYRVEVSTGLREIVFETDNREIHMVGVSRDGTRAAASKPNGWHVWAYDLVLGLERDLRMGCQGTASPMGTMVTRNGYYHRTATVERLADLSVVAGFAIPEAHDEFQMHRFAHGSGGHVLFTADRDYAYLHDLVDGTQTFLARGSAWDFFPTQPQSPIIAIDRGRLDFVASPDGVWSLAREVLVRNEGGGSLAAPGVVVDGAPTWLSFVVEARGDAFAIQHQVTPAELGPGEHHARVELSSAGAQLSPASYDVTLLVLEQSVPLRVNCGDEPALAADWQRDAFFVLDGQSAPPVCEVSIEGVADAAPAPVYVRQREGYRHGLQLPVGDGLYTLRLHLMTYRPETAPFDIWVEGALAVEDLDVAARAGGVCRPYVLDQRVVVSGGDGLQLAVEAETLGGICGVEVLPPGAENLAPVVDAGADLLTWIDAPTPLSGAAVDDGMPGGALSLRWSQLDGPAAVQIEDAEAARTSALFPAAGRYQLELRAYDGELDATDRLAVTVIDPTTNTPPQVEAGPNQTVALGAAIQLAGQVFDDGLPDGTLSIAWSVVAGPGPVRIESPSAAQGLATVESPGIYQLQLWASDGELEALDLVEIKVEQVSPPSLALLAPRGGERWPVGSTQLIVWNARGLGDVTLRYSVDDGLTWRQIVTSVDDTAPEWGAYPWQVPAPASTACRVQVAGYFGETEVISERFALVEVGEDGGASEGGQARGDAGAATPAGGGCACRGGVPATPGGALCSLAIALWVSLRARGRSRRCAARHSRARRTPPAPSRG